MGWNEGKDELKDECFLMDDAISDGPMLPLDIEKPEDRGGTIMVVRGYAALIHLGVNIQAIMG